LPVRFEHRRLRRAANLAQHPPIVFQPLRQPRQRLPFTDQVEPRFPRDERRVRQARHADAKVRLAREEAEIHAVALCVLQRIRGVGHEREATPQRLADLLVDGCHVDRVREHERN